MTIHFRELLILLCLFELFIYEAVPSLLVLYDDTVSDFGYGASAVIDELGIELLTDEEVEDDLDGEDGETFDVVAALEGDEFDNDVAIDALATEALTEVVDDLDDKDDDTPETATTFLACSCFLFLSSSCCLFFSSLAFSISFFIFSCSLFFCSFSISIAVARVFLAAAIIS